MVSICLTTPPPITIIIYISSAGGRRRELCLPVCSSHWRPWQPGKLPQLVHPQANSFYRISTISLFYTASSKWQVLCMKPICETGQSVISVMDRIWNSCRRFSRNCYSEKSNLRGVGIWLWGWHLVTNVSTRAQIVKGSNGFWIWCFACGNVSQLFIIILCSAAGRCSAERQNQRNGSRTSFPRKSTMTCRARCDQNLSNYIQILVISW